MNQPDLDRLDSWKAIANHLQRDERTARRWEQLLALPVRRVQGNRGQSVFAYASEIDAWLKKAPLEARPAETAVVGSVWRARAWQMAAVGATVVVVAALAWRARGLAAIETPINVRFTPTAIIAVGADGAEQWRYPFSQEAPASVAIDHPAPEWLPSGTHARVLVGTAIRTQVATNVVTGGQLLWLTAAGHLERTFSFDDRVAFGAGAYAAPWCITDFHVTGARDASLVAVAARQVQWWPSVVTVLDAQGTRRGTFVNAGWIDWLLWVTRDRLIIGGFSNFRDGGMIALLDTNALDGQSPTPVDSPFHCHGCGAGSPLRYVTLPRSEINRVTSSGFNGVMLERSAKSVIARTNEAAANDNERVEALYEFSPTLEIEHASYSDQYWAMHKELEAQGKITHTRAQCPDRDGPRQIDVWEPATGWRVVTIPR